MDIDKIFMDLLISIPEDVLLFFREFSKKSVNIPKDKVISFEFTV